MKVVTIIGARPQFIKAAAVSRAIAAHNTGKDEKDTVQEIIVHTGQHYDDNMSAVFFRELEIPEPDINLGVGSGTHAVQTGEMLIRIETVLQQQAPEWVLVYGDTNSTLAGALAAVKLQMPVAHVEAGLRSFNRRMPEEINRVLTDHIATLLFCPTLQAVENLDAEGFLPDDRGREPAPRGHAHNRKVLLVGDVMYDSVRHNVSIAETKSRLMAKMRLQPKGYALATVHRAENTDNPENLRSIFDALNMISAAGLAVVVPLHPRTRKSLSRLDWTRHAGLILIDPVSYMDMLLLEKHARVILTDSGGVQKEAYWFAVPCVTLREETEWIETVGAGWNVLAGAESERILHAAKSAAPAKSSEKLYGDGRAAQYILRHLLLKIDE